MSGKKIFVFFPGGQAKRGPRQTSSGRRGGSNDLPPLINTVLLKGGTLHYNQEVLYFMNTNAGWLIVNGNRLQIKRKQFEKVIDSLEVI